MKVVLLGILVRSGPAKTIFELLSILPIPSIVQLLNLECQIKNILGYIAAMKPEEWRKVANVSRTTRTPHI